MIKSIYFWFLLFSQVTGKKTFTSPVHYSGQFPVVQYVVVGNYLDDRPLAVDVGSLCQVVDTSADIIHWNDWTVGGKSCWCFVKTFLIA